MQFKTVLIIFVGLFVFQNGNAAEELGPPPVPFCITNKAEYLAKKDQLPEILRGIENLPHGKMYRLSGLLDRIAAKAAMKVRIADNNKLIFDAAVAGGGQLFYVEDTYISKICVEGSEVRIDLENKKSYTAIIKDSTSFELAGGTFKATTELEFAQEVNAVNVKINNANAAPPPTKSNGSPKTPYSGRK